MGYAEATPLGEAKALFHGDLWSLLTETKSAIMRLPRRNHAAN
jgi:hypothetical protein